MKSEHAVMQAAFNLLKAAEENQRQLRDLINNIESSSTMLESKTRTMDNTITTVINRSIQDATVEISKRITNDLSKANELANVAAERLDESSRKSFIIFSMLHILFFVLGVFVLWFFFMKDIPTREELMDMQNTANELEKYGYLYDCNGRKCIEIGGDSGLVTRKTNEKLYYLKPRH